MGKRRFLAAAALLSLLSVTVLGAGIDLKALYTGKIEAAAKNHGIPVDFLHAVIRFESNYDMSAISAKGAIGLMQLMPGTAARYGVRDIYDPGQNIDGGCRYLKELMKLYNNDTKMVLAAYNAGQEAVKRYGKIPPYPETRAYIQRIMTAYRKPTIGNSKIYTFRDKQGRLVMTNDYYHYLLNRTD
jgi:soluble lytic murein transglycosylase-like protein